LKNLLGWRRTFILVVIFYSGFDNLKVASLDHCSLNLFVNVFGSNYCIIFFSWEF
jgi:hypothetical protein